MATCSELSSKMPPAFQSNMELDCSALLVSVPSVEWALLWRVVGSYDIDAPPVASARRVVGLFDPAPEWSRDPEWSRA